MTSQDLFNQSTGFLDLLSSQLGPQTHEIRNAEMASPCVEVGDSKACLQSNWSKATSEVSADGIERRSRRKWTPTEDLVLISTWLNTSKDTITSNELKAEAFWKRIASYFAASPQVVGLPKREPSNCKQRWGKINDIVCKFVGCYEAATSQQSSGQNENDVMKLAHHIFFNDYRQKFTMEHAWRELRHDQKWCKKETGDQSKRRKVAASSTQSSTSVSGSFADDQVRPPGVKAYKTKGKKTGIREDETLVSFQKMWAIKEKDLAMKDKLSKMKLLDSLLARSEALSEIETALKNKLITEILNV